MPSSEIIAVGTEILLGDIVDTNSQALGRVLAECGISHKRRTTIGDHLDRCADAVREALERADIVLTIGGLGPTGDDITREAIGRAVGEEMVEDKDALEELRAYVSSRGREWREAYARQAMRPASSRCLPNDAGTAPGIHWSNGGKHVIAMPGPRNEFLGMLEKSVRPILVGLSDSVIQSRTLRILGVPEATLEELFAKEMDGENPTVSPYAKVGEVHLRITARARNHEEADAMISPLIDSISSRLGKAVYSDRNEDLAEVIINELASRKQSLAIAESCTGGMLGARLTSIPGASAVFAGGIIGYSDVVKANVLHVVPEDLEKFGAVSEEIARQMATNVRSRIGSTYGLSITGVAGPGGGSEAKPVGLVYLGVSTPTGSRVEECRFRGSREQIREISVQRSLALLWEVIGES